jgi:nucleotidyltransferase/DNA polymerase involved in DNA repair
MELGIASLGIGSPAWSLLKEFRGVPKTALQTVFGNGLGGRIWQQARHGSGLAELPAGAKTSSPEPTTVSDGEIVAGMIAYVSRRAGEALIRNRQQAREIGLKLVYTDGRVSAGRSRLLQGTSDPQQLYAAAMTLFRKAETDGVPVATVKLSVSTCRTEAALARPEGLNCALAAAVAT